MRPERILWNFGCSIWNMTRGPSESFRRLQPRQVGVNPWPRAKARGVACLHAFGSYVAQVAEVSVEEKTGVVKVHRVVCAVDCGPIVNPDTIVAQMEGAITMGLSAALKEKIEFAEGGVKSANFLDYHLLRISEAPDVEVHSVESDGEIGGVGEPGVPPLAPAVSNAVFAATGARIPTVADDAGSRPTGNKTSLTRTTPDPP